LLNVASGADLANDFPSQALALRSALRLLEQSLVLQSYCHLAC
jgi:hypothetical protein